MIVTMKQLNSIELLTLVVQLRRHGGDDGDTEAKRARESLPSSLWESISAFANVAGGRLLLGVDEKLGFQVTGVSNPALFESQIGELCANQMEPPVRATIYTVEIEGLSVLVVDIPAIPRAQRPCHLRSKGAFAGSRLRVGDGDRKLSEYEVALLLGERNQPLHDRQPVTGSTTNDLDSTALSEFVSRLRKTRMQLFADRSDSEVLLLLNVLVDRDGKPLPTLAGLLAFGRYPQQFYPQLNITFVSYPGIEPGLEGSFGERFLDNVAIDGNIPTMVKTAMGIVQRNMKHRSTIQGAFRVDSPEYPLESIREAIVNAMVHRDYGPYSLGMQVQIEMYSDRLVVRNCGGLYGPIDPNDLGLVPATSARNQALLKILEDAVAEPGRTVCENRGSGIYTMRRGLQLAHLPPPVFTDAVSTFTVSMGNQRHTEIRSSNTIKENVLAALSSTPKSRTEISELVHADPQAVSSMLVQLRKEGFATLLGAPRSRSSKWIKTTLGED